MTMKKLSYGLTLILIIGLVGCTCQCPTKPSSPGAAFTQAAETVAAELTKVSSQALRHPMHRQIQQLLLIPIRLSLPIHMFLRNQHSHTV